MFIWLCYAIVLLIMSVRLKIEFKIASLKENRIKTK